MTDRVSAEERNRFMKKNKKSYVVLGIGGFGESLAIALEQHGNEVMAIDFDREKVHAIAPFVTCSLQLDVTNENALKGLGIEKMDAAIISIGENLEASVMATILIKEMGVPRIYAKAENELHKTILLRVGADKVIFPEKEMGERLAMMMSGNFRDYFKLSDKVGMVDMLMKKEWTGKSLIELDFRNRYGVTVVAIKRAGEVLFISPNEKLKQEDQIVIVGEIERLEELQ